jgi:hypothetical protein
MKKREKILTGAVLGIVAMFVLGFGIRAFFLKPLRDIDKQTATINEKIAKINQERREYFSAEDALKSITQKTFSPDPNEASARCGEMITRQIAAAGLSESDFTRLPAGSRRLRGASEIGWSIQGKGDLTKIVNLLFLLETSAQIHRLENVTLTSYEKPGEIRVRFVYLTLVIEPAPEVDPIDLKPKFNLESPERLAYNSILERDILRPYIKLPPPPPASSRPGAPGAGTPPPGPESLKVVSLSEWEGQPEVHIRDTARNETFRYRPGDKLKDMKIVAVDYRAMPLPRNPQLLSHSRVILQIQDEYWAVERGQTLAEKRKLEANEWPAH